MGYLGQRPCSPSTMKLPFITGAHSSWQPAALLPTGAWASYLKTWHWDKCLSSEGFAEDISSLSALVWRSLSSCFLEVNLITPFIFKIYPFKRTFYCYHFCLFAYTLLILLLWLWIAFFFFFFLFFGFWFCYGCTCIIWKFPARGQIGVAAVAYANIYGNAGLSEATDRTQILIETSDP